MRKLLMSASVAGALLLASLASAFAQMHVGYMNIPAPGFLCDQSRVGCSNGPRGSNYRVQHRPQQHYAPRQVRRPPPPPIYRYQQLEQRRAILRGGHEYRGSGIRRTERVVRRERVVTRRSASSRGSHVLRRVPAQPGVCTSATLNAATGQFDWHC